MKTVQDLVDSLNANVNDIGEFSVSKDFEDDFYLFCDHDGNKSRILCFDTESGETYQESGFPLLNWEAIRLISDYVTNHGSDDWFEKKRYNIIIANCTDGAKTYWKTDMNDFITFTTQDDKSKSIDFIFTESEIEELKSTLPENMAKIVDLGKVEVKDEIA